MAESTPVPDPAARRDFYVKTLIAQYRGMSPRRRRRFWRRYPILEIALRHLIEEELL